MQVLDLSLSLFFVSLAWLTMSLVVEITIQSQRSKEKGANALFTTNDVARGWIYHPIKVFKKEARNALFTNLQAASRANKLRAISGDLVEEWNVNIKSVT